MKYILIMIILSGGTYGGNTVNTQEFKDEAACQNAASEFIANTTDRRVPRDVRALCVEKGPVA